MMTINKVWSRWRLNVWRPEPCGHTHRASRSQWARDMVEVIADRGPAKIQYCSCGATRIKYK